MRQREGQHPLRQGAQEQEGTGEMGRITLVGAGPGDPELLTLAGQKALAEADLVVYDRLVNPLLLAHAARAELIYIGKEVGEAHAATQARINELITVQARQGRRVVRLKGGDPYIFGRGGEEALAARAQGIPFRVIPGVTAGIAAGAGADIPLTHREVAASVAFVTGCASDGHGHGEQNRRMDWAALARAVDTIVIYMGVRHLQGIAEALLEGGRTAEEPIAIVHAATLPEQEVLTFTLGEVAAGRAEESIKAPSIVIVGQVVHLRERLAALVSETVAR